MESCKTESKDSKSCESRRSNVDSKNSKDNGNRTPPSTGCHRTVSHISSISIFTSNISGETSKPPIEISKPPIETSSSKRLIKPSSSRGSISKKSKSRSNHSKVCPCINSLIGLKPKIRLSASSLPPGVAGCDCNVDVDTSSASPTRYIGKRPEFRSHSTSITSFCLPNRRSLVTNSTLDEFEKHVNKVVDMTFNYQDEGLLCKTDKFLKACEAVKDKIQKFKETRKVKAKLEHLKQQVTNLETITNVVKEELSYFTSVGSFLSCCNEFKNKLDHHETPKASQPPSNVQKLVNQIDDSILLSNEAKQKGLVTSESVDEFIKNCNRIKAKVLSEPRKLQKPETINRLLFNINSIIAFISKYRKAVSVSDSIENFYKTCLNTRQNLTSYKDNSQRDRKRSSSSGKQGTSSQCNDNICGEDSICNKSASKSLSFQKTKREKNMCCKSSKVTRQASNFSNKSTSTGPTLTKRAQSTRSSSSSCRPSCGPSLPKVTPCSRSTCTQCSHSQGTVTPQRSGIIESLCNSCSEIGKSIISLIKSKNPLRQTVSIVIIKRLQDDHSNSVGNTESVTVKQSVGSQHKPVTSQKSDKSVKLLEVCGASAPTMGLIETVRKVKSACDVSRSCIPVWSRLSLHSNQQKYNNPFFCGSPQDKESDHDIF